MTEFILEFCYWLII